MSLRTRCALAVVVLSVAFCCTAQDAPAAAPSDPKLAAWQILDNAVKDSSWEKRSKAVQVLGLLPDNHEAELMALNALKDQRDEVRASAAGALGSMGAKTAIPQLIEAVHDTEIGVVLAAAKSLVTLGDHRGYEVYYAILTGETKTGKGLVAEQKKMLKDPNALAKFGFEQGIGFIPFASLGWGTFKMLRKDDVSPIMAASALMLVNDPDPRSGKALAQSAATDKSWIVRAAALNAIAKRGDPSLKPAAIGQLQDSKEEVQYSAAAAVIRLSEVQPKKPAVHGHRPPPKAKKK